MNQNVMVGDTIEYGGYSGVVVWVRESDKHEELPFCVFKVSHVGHDSLSNPEWKPFLEEYGIDQSQFDYMKKGGYFNSWDQPRILKKRVRQLELF